MIIPFVILAKFECPSCRREHRDVLVETTTAGYDVFPSDEDLFRVKCPTTGKTVLFKKRYGSPLVKMMGHYLPGEVYEEGKHVLTDVGYLDEDSKTLTLDVPCDIPIVLNEPFDDNRFLLWV